MSDFITRLAEPVAGVFANTIAIQGSDSTYADTADASNLSTILGVYSEDAIQDDPVSIQTTGRALVLIDSDVVKGEYAVSGADGYAYPESGITDGSEMNVIGVFMESATFAPGLALVPIMVQIGKRIRRNTETITGTGAQTATADGTTVINRGAGSNTDITLPNGTYDGQFKYIYRMENLAGTVRIIVTNHIISSPYTLRLHKQGSAALFVWNHTDSKWQTVSAMGARDTTYADGAGILFARGGISVEIAGNLRYDEATGLESLGPVIIGTTGSLVFEGSTANDYETTLGVVDPTADRSILLPDASGTIALVGGAGIGDVVGPGSATDNALARFDSTTGKLIQNSALIIDDSGNVTGVAALTMSGVLTVSSGGETLTITANSPANTVTYSTYPSANMVFVSGGNLDFDMYDSGTGAAKMRFLFGGADKGAYVDDLGEIVAKKFICSTGGETLTITANSPANAVTISCDPTSNLYIDSGGDMYFDIYATGAGTAKFRFTAGGSEKATIDDLGAAVFLSVSTGNGAVELYPSGTYTPTLTNVANVGASTAYSCQYHRVGDIVHVSGKVDVDPTTTLVLTQLGISLPIASNFANANECAGTAVAPAISGGTGCAAILGEATNNRAELQMTPVDVANQSFYFTFTYRVI